MTAEVASWLDALEGVAPDTVAAYRGIEPQDSSSVRREVRRRAGAGSTAALVRQLAGLADALVAIVQELPERTFAESGGEEDWNVAQAIGHDANARAGLVLAASRAAAHRWPASAPAVVPGVPGPADATPADLVRQIEQSQRVIERVARSIDGHELESCPLDHPIVGRLRCGEWLLFAGVHDLMHLEQLHELGRRA